MNIKIDNSNIMMNGNSLIDKKVSNNEEDIKRKNIYAGNLNNNQQLTPYERKREIARDKAKHILENAFKVNQGMREVRDNLKDENKKLTDENSETLSAIDSLEKERDEKVGKYSNDEVIGELNKSYSKQIAAHKLSVRENLKQSRDNNFTINTLNKAIQKDQSMVKASEEADKINAEADKTMIADIFQTGFKEYEKKLDDETERIEEIKEKNKEQKEEQEEIKEAGEKSENPEIKDIEDMDVEQKIFDVFKEMDMEEYLSEDLKGLIIDAIK